MATGSAVRRVPLIHTVRGDGFVRHFTTLFSAVRRDPLVRGGYGVGPHFGRFFTQEKKPKLWMRDNGTIGSAMVPLVHTTVLEYGFVRRFSNSFSQTGKKEKPKIWIRRNGGEKRLLNDEETQDFMKKKKLMELHDDDDDDWIGPFPFPDRPMEDLNMRGKNDAVLHNFLKNKKALVQLMEEMHDHNKPLPVTETQFYSKCIEHFEILVTCTCLNYDEEALSGDLRAKVKRMVANTRKFLFDFTEPKKEKTAMEEKEAKLMDHVHILLKYHDYDEETFGEEVNIKLANARNHLLSVLERTQEEPRPNEEILEEVIEINDRLKFVPRALPIPMAITMDCELRPMNVQEILHERREFKRAYGRLPMNDEELLEFLEAKILLHIYKVEYGGDLLLEELAQHANVLFKYHDYDEETLVFAIRRKMAFARWYMFDFAYPYVSLSLVPPRLCKLTWMPDPKECKVEAKKEKAPSEVNTENMAKLVYQFMEHIHVLVKHRFDDEETLMGDIQIKLTNARKFLLSFIKSKNKKEDRERSHFPPLLYVDVETNE